jgi:hypothetical protein
MKIFNFNIKPIYIILVLLVIVFIVSGLGSSVKEGYAGMSDFNPITMYDPKVNYYFERSKNIDDVNAFLKRVEKTNFNTTTFIENFNKFYTLTVKYTIQTCMKEFDENNDGKVIENKQTYGFVRDNSGNEVLPTSSPNILATYNKGTLIQINEINSVTSKLETQILTLSALEQKNIKLYMFELFINTMLILYSVLIDTSNAFDIDKYFLKIMYTTSKIGVNIDSYGYDASPESVALGYGLTSSSSSSRYDANGYDYRGYDAKGYNANGYNALGYDIYGYNARGYDINGYDKNGFDINGIDKYGKKIYESSSSLYGSSSSSSGGSSSGGSSSSSSSSSGYNSQGYDKYGYDAKGYDEYGYDAKGYNVQGYDKYGKKYISSAGSGYGTTTSYSELLSKSPNSSSSISPKASLGTSAGAYASSPLLPLPMADSTTSGITASNIAPKSADLYMLKTQMLPPNSPGGGCSTTAASQPNNIRPSEVPPCPPCERCPEPAFDCKKVPNYNSTQGNKYLPRPVLASFSQFGM